MTTSSSSSNDSPLSTSKISISHKTSSMNKTANNRVQQQENSSGSTGKGSVVGGKETPTTISGESSRLGIKSSSSSTTNKTSSTVKTQSSARVSGVIGQTTKPTSSSSSKAVSKATSSLVHKTTTSTKKVPSTSNSTSSNNNNIKLTSPQEDLYSIHKLSSNDQFASHVEHLAGPILFSAPHGLQVYRGGEASGDSERVHSKELYTNEICLLLSLKMKKYLGIEGSFVIWNQKTAKPKDKNNLDPNYLVANQFMSSSFHLCLHKLKKQYEGFPTLHIDIHGKINRKDNRNIDIGIAPMIALWSDSKNAELVKKDFCNRIQQAVSTCKKTYSGFKLTIDRDPYLSGYWGDNTVTTISHQSILLGMPALQLEIPMDVRKDLMENDSLVEELAKAIADTYKNSVTTIFNKEWKQVETKLGEIKTELSAQQQTKHNSKTFDSMISQMLAEFAIIEKTQTFKKI